MSAEKRQHIESLMLGGSYSLHGDEVDAPGESSDRKRARRKPENPQKVDGAGAGAGSSSQEAWVAPSVPQPLASASAASGSPAKAGRTDGGGGGQPGSAGAAPTQGAPSMPRPALPPQA